MNSIEESLEAILTVAGVSKGLKGSLSKRLRTAAIIRGSSVELQRRLCVEDREAPDVVKAASDAMEQQRRAVLAEA